MSEQVDRRRPGASARYVLGRALSYGAAVLGGFHPRYALVYGAAHLVPMFTVGPLIARAYRWAGFTVGRDCTFAGPVRIIIGQGDEGNLAIGEDVLISSDVTINVDERVTIGDRASLGPFVQIYTANHPLGPGSRRMLRTAVDRPVHIGRGAWLRIGAVVLPGVTVGEGAVVGAGSVVASDVEPHTLVAGNPAVPVRTLDDADV